MTEAFMHGTTATTAVFPPTMEDLEKSLSEAEDKIIGLENNVQYWMNAHQKVALQVSYLEEYLKGSHQYMDEDVVQSLVDIFDLELTKDYDVQVTVRFSGTITAPIDYDMDSLENELTAELAISYYSGLDGDISEDQMEIDWSEN